MTTKNSNRKHYWLCALTGLLSGFLAFFICTHNFEFFWPFNWPVRITAVEPCKLVTVEVMPTPTADDDGHTSYSGGCEGTSVRVGDTVKVDRSAREVIGKVISVKASYLWPIRVHFDDKPLHPKPLKDLIEGDNWEDFSCGEILKVNP